MGWCAESGWVLLVFLSVLTVLLSVAISLAGGIFKFSPELFLDLPWRYPDEENVQSLSVSKGYTPVLSEVGVALMAVGAAMCVLSFLACVGACCKFRVLLIVFAVFDTLVICAITITTGMFLDRSSVLKCCGVAGPADLDSDWRTDPDNVMTSCCKSVSDTGCPRDGHDIHKLGCYEAVCDLVLGEHITWVILPLTTVLILMLLQTMTASVIALKLQRNKVEPQ